MGQNWLQAFVLSGCLMVSAGCGGVNEISELRQSLRDASVLLDDVMRPTDPSVVIRRRPESPVAITMTSPSDKHYTRYRIAKVLDKIAIAQAQLDDVAGSTETRKRSQAYARNDLKEVLYEIAMAKARKGDAKVAYTQSLHFREKVSVLLEVATFHRQAGNVGEVANWLHRAIQLTGLQDDYGKSVGYVKISLWQWHHDNEDEAEKMLQTAFVSARAEKRRVYRILSMREIALAQEKMGEGTAAIETLSKTAEEVKGFDDSKPAFQKQWVLRCIAMTMVKVGDLRGAMKIADSMDWNIDKSSPVFNKQIEIFRDIAFAQLRRGNIKETLTILKRIEYEPFRQDILIAASRTEAEAKNLSGALEMSKQIKGGSQRARALLEVAVAQARAGDKEGARKTAALTSFLRIKVADRNTIFKYNDPATWGVDYKPPRAFLVTNCEGIPASWDSRAGLATSAMRLFQALGQGKTYEKYANDFKDLPEYILRQIAKVQAEEGDIKGAIKWCRGISSPRSKALAFLGAAEGYLLGVHNENSVRDKK